MELFRALGALSEPPTPTSARLAESLELGPLPEAGEYERVFLFQLYPYASVYLGAEGQVGGEARDRVAGFWRALEQAPPAEPDHLAVMLGLYAELAEQESGARGTRERSGWGLARRAWFWEHLASWLPVYALSMRRITDGFYRRWGDLLFEAMTVEAERLGAPEAAPLHLREAPGLEDPRETEQPALLEQLLAPIRAGFVVLPSDLSRAARELELGSRAGERRFQLGALLGQDTPSTLEWLAEHAARAAESYRASLATFALASDFWSHRATSAERLLRQLAEDARAAQLLP